VVFGEPIVVPAAADRPAIEAKREELETALRRVTAAADRAAGVPDVPAV
jgi:hypothetical protein